MKPVLSTEEVVRLEDIIEREGTSKAELMELAGEFAANEILKLNPDRVLVLVGFGNNGGDGWVAADILTHKGVDVDIVSPVEPDEIPAALARHVARRTAGRDVHVCVGPTGNVLHSSSSITPMSFPPSAISMVSVSGQQAAIAILSCHLGSPG